MAKIYSAAFNAVAVTAAQDVFEIVAGTNLTIREVRLGQHSDFGDAQAEILSVQILRGYTTTGSGGAAVTPAAVNSQANNAASTATVARNNTTVATTGTAAILLSDAFNVQTGFRFKPDADERPELSAGQRLVVRITIPVDALTMDGWMEFEEA